MVVLRVKKGLDIPAEGAPYGEPEPLFINGQLQRPKVVSLDVSCLPEVGFRLLLKPGDVVKCGEALVLDKKHPERVFVSPAGGIVKEVNRGVKRRLLSIDVEVSSHEEMHELSPLSLSSSRETIIARLLEGGVLPHIRQRPFDILADPTKEPKAIFVKAIETAPFATPPEFQVKGHEEAFKVGLEALKKCTKGKVHLVYQEGSTFAPFVQAEGVEVHSISGPHPAGNPSVHIHMIDPINRVDDVVWTIDVIGVLSVGYLLSKGRYFVDRVIGVAGDGVIAERRKFVKGRQGIPVSSLVEGRIPKESVRFVSGDPLMGHKADMTDPLGFYDTTISVIPTREGQQFLHFFRLGANKYSASKAYLSAFFKKKLFSFDTNQHGERRPFVIGAPYDKVMPLRLNTMQLVKAVMAEDFDLAEELGLLEVAPEDFALPTFVCPCKIEMIDIIRDGLRRHCEEVLG